MTIFYHRIGQPAGRGAPIALRALAKRPAEIESRLRRGHDIHFFDRALPDVADDQCRTREGGAEGIAQAKGIDIGIAAARQEGIARRGRIAVAARADREAQYLAEPRTAILRIVAGVARSAAVTDRDIDVALGPIADPAAVVIAVFGMRNAEHRIVGGRGIG